MKKEGSFNTYEEQFTSGKQKLAKNFHQNWAENQEGKRVLYLQQLLSPTTWQKLNFVPRSFLQKRPHNLPKVVSFRLSTGQIILREELTSIIEDKSKPSSKLNIYTVH